MLKDVRLVGRLPVSAGDSAQSHAALSLPSNPIRPSVPGTDRQRSARLTSGSKRLLPPKTSAKSDSLSSRAPAPCSRLSGVTSAVCSPLVLQSCSKSENYDEMWLRVNVLVTHIWFSLRFYLKFSCFLKNNLLLGRTSSRGVPERDRNVWRCITHSVVAGSVLMRCRPGI